MAAVPFPPVNVNPPKSFWRRAGIILLGCLVIDLVWQAVATILSTPLAILSTKVDLVGWFWLTLAAIYSLRAWILALRSRLFLAADRPVTGATAFWATTVGELGDAYLPLRGGEWLRVWVLAQTTGIKVGFILGARLTEYAIDVLLLILSAFFLGVSTTSALSELLYTGLGRILLVSLGWGIFLGAGSALGRWFQAGTVKIFRQKTWLPGFIDFCEHFRRGVLSFRNGRRMLAFILLSIPVGVVNLCVIFLSVVAAQQTITLLQAGLALVADEIAPMAGLWMFSDVMVLRFLDPSLVSSTSREISLYLVTGTLLHWWVVSLWGLVGLWYMRHSLVGELWAWVRRPKNAEN